MTINKLVLPWVVFISTVFVLCNVAFGDDASLRKLSDIRVVVKVPDDSGPLSFQLRNALELNLQKTGIKINSDAAAELRLDVIWVDIDPQKKEILGKYGTG